MLVLGVDQVSSEATEDPIVVNVVTLLAVPEQAKSLTLAQRVGDLTLLLRNEGDRGEDESPDIALDDLWEFSPEEAMLRAANLISVSDSTGSGTAQLAPNQREVQVIRGLEVREETVDTGASTAPSRAGGQN
jgi:pilus assembly protein CpaB